MDDPMPKLPRYVFRRANGSFRYKRNVPKALRGVFGKDTLYRQLGQSYDEAILNLPRVHQEVEALFRYEAMVHPGEKAAALIRTHLGEVWVRAAEEGKVGQEEDTLPIDDYMDLADELEDEGGIPPEVLRRVRGGYIDKPAMTLERIFAIYLKDKALTPKVQHDLELRIERIRKQVVACLGPSFWTYTALGNIRRRDASALRDSMLQGMAPNSVARTLNILKAAINHVIREEELDEKNPFVALKIEGAGASKTDRLPLSDQDMVALDKAFDTNPIARALFITLADTGARLAEITGLQVKDIDVEGATLEIRANGLRRLKTRNSERTIPLSPRALACLAPFLDGKDPGAPIFERYSGPRGNDTASAMLMGRLRSQITDKKKTIHSLRHRMKDKLRNSGCPEHLSMAIMGHSTNSIAANYGLGYSISVMKDALEKVWRAQ